MLVVELLFSAAKEQGMVVIVIIRIASFFEKFWEGEGFEKDVRVGFPFIFITCCEFCGV